MKIHFSKIAFAASILLALPFSLQSAYAQSVLLHDKFEVSYDGWFANGDYAKITALPGAGYSMSRGMKITDRHSPSEGAMSEKGFYLSGGEEYDYSVFVRHEQPVAETYNLTLRWLYPDGVTYGSKVIASAAVPSGKWVSLAAKFTAPQNTVNLTLIITTNSTGDFFFDDVKVTQKQNGAIKAQAKTLAEVGLKDIYAGYFRIGSVLNSGTVNNNAIKALIIKEFNSITTENEMKPDATLNQTGSTNADIKVRLNNAASTLKFCSDNNIGFRGHTLVWHSQTPQWFFKDNFQNGGNWVTKAVMKQRLESYIRNMFAIIKEQYPNLDLYAYDVVNEATSDNSARTNDTYKGAREPGYNDGKSPWVQVYGDNSFIEDAFTFARQYAPRTTKLFYNDYNEYWDHKRNSIIKNILTPLRTKGVLDGMGMQSHISADNNVNAFAGINSYRTALNMYADVGEVQVTELDISTEGGKYTLTQQALRYKAVFSDAINKRNAVSAVVVWGPNDANSWVGTDKESGKSNAPLLFDANNNRKPAWDTVAALVPQSNWNGSSNSVQSSSSRPPSSSSVRPSSSSVRPSSSSTIISSSSTYNVTCNVDNLQSSYLQGSNVPRPNVSCGTGVTVGTASFFINSSEITGWASAGGTHALWNTGTRTVILTSIECNGNTITPDIFCGYFDIVAPSSSSVAVSSSSSAGGTPITNHSLLATSHSPLYYSIKGEPLGQTKPQKAGIYLVKQGSSIQKIVVR